MRKVTHIVLFLVLASTCFCRELFAGYAAVQQDPGIERSNKAKRGFPTADFDEPDSDESVTSRSMKEKRRRYDTFKFVASKPEPWVAERVIINEGFFDFPALPVIESDLIVIGMVSNSAAHISGNRKNVFSEFNLTVESVLKTSSEEIKQGSLLTVDRIGGFVKYPNGQKILFRINGLNMPEIGSRYLFFLDAKKKPDLIILTAYELTPQGVMSLDTSSQFLSLEGLTETELQNRVLNLLKK